MLTLRLVVHGDGKEVARMFDSLERAGGMKRVPKEEDHGAFIAQAAKFFGAA